MTQQEKLAVLEEMFEFDAGTLHPDTALDSIQWDSMSKLSLIALVNDRFNKRLSGPQLNSFKTIEDILVVME